LFHKFIELNNFWKFWLLLVKRGFHPTQRTQRKERNEMTSLLDIGQSQPLATTAYAAGTLPSCGRHAVKWHYWN